MLPSFSVQSQGSAWYFSICFPLIFVYPYPMHSDRGARLRFTPGGSTGGDRAMQGRAREPRPVHFSKGPPLSSANR